MNDSPASKRRLAACPFCGGVHVYKSTNGDGNHFVECDACGASGPAAADPGLAKMAWDTRAALTPEPCEDCNGTGTVHVKSRPGGIEVDGERPCGCMGALCVVRDQAWMLPPGVSCSSAAEVSHDRK